MDITLELYVALMKNTIALRKRRTNFLRILLIIKWIRQRRTSALAYLPLDILLYLIRFFNQADFGLSPDKLLKTTKAIFIGQ